MFACTQAKQGIFVVQGMRCGDIDHIDAGVFGKRLVDAMGARKTMGTGKGAGA